LLLSRGVNSPRLCYVNNEVDSVTPYFTLNCYYFETAQGADISTKMAEGLMTFFLNLILNLLLFWNICYCHVI